MVSFLGTQFWQFKSDFQTFLRTWRLLMHLQLRRAELHHAPRLVPVHLGFDWGRQCLGVIGGVFDPAVIGRTYHGQT